MAEKLKCTGCGATWTYFGYPAYIGCPECNCLKQEPINHKETCPTCKGSGEIITNEVREEKYNNLHIGKEIRKVAKQSVEKHS